MTTSTPTKKKTTRKKAATKRPASAGKSRRGKGKPTNTLASSLEALSDKVNIKRKKDGTRRRAGGRADDVTEALAECETLEQMVELVGKFGITREEVIGRIENAPNFGQVRMVLGNRMRGIVSRRNKLIDAGKEDEANDREKLAYPKGNPWK